MRKNKLVLSRETLLRLTAPDALRDAVGAASAPGTHCLPASCAGSGCPISVCIRTCPELCSLDCR
jgi:hypothetical protein